MEIIAQIITNILTAFYQPFGFSVVLSAMVMFFYLFAYEPTGAGKGWKEAARFIRRRGLSPARNGGKKMSLTDWMTGIQHVGIPTNDIKKPLRSMKPWAFRTFTVPETKPLTKRCAFCK